MHMSGLPGSVKSCFAISGLLMVLLPSSAVAVTQEIRAVFKPDPANPQFNQFQNRTPLSGFCLDNPPQCQAENLFSLRLPIQTHSNTTIRRSHSNVRQGAMFNIPSQWQSITVTHPTAPPQVVKFRIAGMGVSYRLPKPAPELTDGAGHNHLWEGSIWAYAGPPCAGLSGAGDDIGFNSFWRHPVGTGACAKKAMFDIPQPFKYETFDITYELVTPNPMAMVEGQYTGQHTFRVGPNQDFDLGDVMIPNDDIIVLDFHLDVEHQLKIDVPPGGEKVRLAPAGGWQSWLHSGRRPERIFRDQTFNISASSRFKMYLDCRFGPGRACYLDDGNNVFVPIEVSVSLPGGLMDSSGRPVNREVLKVGEAAGLQVQPSQYVDRQPGTLHFELHKDAIEIVLLPYTGKHYRGNVVVIWDSEV
ncbi:hypothetical protein [Pseudomonas laurylsulfatiphila]|uniref:hypothetical protein n=1 Tax=Pseudomonas laurylsulfatiphila TaxID=2011015 RepID=UPI003D224FB0|nr:hypothetical protein [Pseudomonas reinekei]MDF9905353.1 hypothetical protein [Pseudomonas reinekei]